MKLQNLPPKWNYIQRPENVTPFQEKEPELKNCPCLVEATAKLLDLIA